MGRGKYYSAIFHPQQAVFPYEAVRETPIYDFYDEEGML
jgi:hypothetical protein